MEWRQVLQAIELAAFVLLGLVGIGVVWASRRRVPVWIHAIAILGAAGGAWFVLWLRSAGATQSAWMWLFVLVLPAIVYVSYGLSRLTSEERNEEEQEEQGNEKDSGPETGPAGLRLDERERAARIGIYALNAHGTDSHGWPGACLETVAHCLNRDEVAREIAARPLKPGWDDFRASGPVSLLELLQWGSLPLEEARSFLGRVEAGEPHVDLPPSLDESEKARAAQITVYYVWYEDRFHDGGDRDSFPVAVCLTRQEAEAELARRGRPVAPGEDGYEVVGPCSLADERRPEVVREVLRLAASGNAGIVAVPI